MARILALPHDGVNMDTEEVRMSEIKFWVPDEALLALKATPEEFGGRDSFGGGGEAI